MVASFGPDLVTELGSMGLREETAQDPLNHKENVPSYFLVTRLGITVLSHYCIGYASLRTVRNMSYLRVPHVVFISISYERNLFGNDYERCHLFLFVRVVSTDLLNR